MIRLCRDCKWSRPVLDGITFLGAKQYTYEGARCGRQDLVAGERGELCRVLRSHEGAEFCGAEAKWFESQAVTATATADQTSPLMP